MDLDSSGNLKMNFQMSEKSREVSKKNRQCRERSGNISNFEFLI